MPVTAIPFFDTVESPDNLVYDDNLINNDNYIISDDIILRADDPRISEESMILKYVDSTQFNAERHIQRLTDLEELNTYVFANADGTRSIYMMNENVKYIDKKGKIKEKDISLINKTGGFGIVQSDIELLIPNNPVKGIDFEYSGFAIKLTPQGLATAASAVKSNNSIEYDQAYGENTKLIYTPMLSGLKEDIVLTEYTDDATYSFVLETDGLNLYNGDNGYYLADSGKADPVFYLGEILIYDAVGKPDSGTMTVETISEGQEYLLTVIANDEFLSDPSTVYPVVIDPSLTVSDSDSGNSILDAPIFEGYPNTNFGAYVYNRLGTPSEEYGIGRTVVKLNGLTSSNEYQTITANQITNVTFYAKESSGGSTQFINLYPLTGNTTWTESTVTWNNVGSHSTAVNYGNTMSNNQWTAFNITDLVKAWKAETYSADAGFIMTNENESNNKSFYSSDCSNTSYRPYVVLNYIDSGSGGGNHYSNAVSLILGNRYSVDINFSGEKRYFKYTPEYDGEFSIESFSIVSGDPYVWVYDSNYILLDSDDDTGDVQNFKLSYYLYSGETYYFAVGCFGTGTGSYQLTLKSTLPAGYTRYTPTDGAYFIMNAHSWRSVYPYNNSDGATVRQYDLYYNNRIPISRKWEIKKQSDGYYSIRNLTSGKYIGVDLSQSLDTNPSVRQYSSSSGNNVRWAMYTTPSDTIILVPKDSRCEPCVYTMSVNIGYNQNNTPLSLFLRSDVTNQQNEWKLIPADFGDQYVSKIQNDQNEQYVYTSNDSVGSQVKSAISITTQNFLWRFEYYGVLAETNEPYYYIKNVATGLYLTAPQNTTNNAPITQADFYPNAQKQLWRLLLQEDGTYTIENRYQYNYNSMPYKLALDNGNLVQTSSVSNIKWNITTQVYTITLVNYYDQGFLERDPNASDTISEINHRVSEICWLNFGLSVNFAIQSYTSCADNCTAGINELCNHCDQIPQCNNRPCEHSHTSRNNIEKDLRAQYGAGNTLLTRVAFCGSIVNNNQSSGAYSSNIVILTTSGRVNANNELEPDYIERYISSMTHEIAHRMSAPDHYCNGKYDAESEKYIGCTTRDCWRCKNSYNAPPQCIMSERGYVFFREKYDYGLLDELFCEQCKSQTNETFGVGYHLTNHHANKNPHN